ncbi:hypothetical protein A253_21102, partial [Pseudomonas syringae pv. actinidiae ICMP 19102]
MNEIQELKDRREQLLKEADQLHTQLLPFEAALESEQSIEPAQERELRDKYNELKRRFDARKHDADLLDRKINRRETLANCDSLMAGYIEAMNTWKADEQELNEKRQSLSIRLEQIQQQAVEDMAKARQAETDAATAYAQAVAWGDTEGEKTANADAQKAAKNLATAAEHDRRQGLIAHSTPSGHPVHQHPATYSTLIRPGSRSAATQVRIVSLKSLSSSISLRACASIRPSTRFDKRYAPAGRGSHRPRS